LKVGVQPLLSLTAIHLYYGAIRNTGGEMSILTSVTEIYKRYTFTNDTLIYSSAGDEYSVLVVHDGTVVGFYIKGPMNQEMVQFKIIRFLSHHLTTKTSVTSVGFLMWRQCRLHRWRILSFICTRNPNEHQFQVRVSTLMRRTRSVSRFNYTFVA
jgi:hypothetical protein